MFSNNIKSDYMYFTLCTHGDKFVKLVINYLKVTILILLQNGLKVPNFVLTNLCYLLFQDLGIIPSVKCCQNVGSSKRRCALKHLTTVTKTSNCTILIDL